MLVQALKCFTVSTSVYIYNDLVCSPADPADPPGNPQIVDYDKDYAEIEWTAPERDNGAPIDGYLIEYREKDSSDWKKVG